MKYTDLTSETWKDLDRFGGHAIGYKSVWLALEEVKESLLHIFVDEIGYYHLAVEDIGMTNVVDPGVTGLAVTRKNYMMDGTVKSVIDIQCNLPNLINEFTGIVKDICCEILVCKVQASEAISRVIRNWQSFWAEIPAARMTDNQIGGLFCELFILRELCRLDPARALNNWRGPVKGKHDFVFSDWSIEVKGTFSDRHIHIINGIDQLAPLENKKLALISFQLFRTENPYADSLLKLVEDIYSYVGKSRLDLIPQFQKSLFLAGYNPVFKDYYSDFKIEILGAALFVVDESFPALTRHILLGELNSRINNISYSINLEGLHMILLPEVKWGDYFY
ncbi:PD-(D/E)XK motif protein [Chitinophaga caseinilytica]|uniref:PD-(D/E)XK motif protein n=1 Tax=Chitinophaga caseinilytica TaxID=2267521 RepID=A0ABZ2Z842_9BACT